MKGSFKKISEKTWIDLNRLSKGELIKLAEIMGIGLNLEPKDDKDEIIVILQTGPEGKIKKGLKNLKHETIKK